MVRSTVAVLLFTLVAIAQDGGSATKPLKAGDPVPANFRAFLATDQRFVLSQEEKDEIAKRLDQAKREGRTREIESLQEELTRPHPRNRPGKIHDLVTDNGLNPVLVAFSRSAPAADAPVAKLARTMSQLVTDFKAERLGAFVIFITMDKEYQEEDNRDAKAKAAEALSAQLQCGNVPFGLSARKSAATDAWGLSDKEDLVVIYYNRMVVQKVWTFSADKPPTEDELKAIREYVQAELKPKR